MKKRLIILCLIVLSLGIYIFYGYKDTTNILLINNSDNIIVKESSYTENISLLQNEYNNTDIKGTIEILNTDYSNPIVQGKDNDYYLTHTPSKKSHILGSVFLDYRVDIDNSKKLIVYGHNGPNYSAPFHILENYYDENYYNNHKIVLIKTQNKVRKYELFSMYVETNDFSYMKVHFTDNSYLKQLNMFKEKSWFKSNVELTKDTNILVLQTCSRHPKYLKYEDRFLLLVFKEVN